jgi:hypothetical protein
MCKPNCECPVKCDACKCEPVDVIETQVQDIVWGRTASAAKPKLVWPPIKEDRG